MTFLELVNKLRADCGIQGDGPASVLNQTGMLAKLVNWTSEAYTEIQTLPPRFRWMRSEVALPISANVFEYALDGTAPWNRSDIESFETNHAVSVDAASNFQTIRPTDYDEFRTSYPLVQNKGMASRLTVTPDFIVRLNSIPDVGYTLRATVRLKPQLLVNDADTPRMPKEFHSVIVYKAKLKYALHDEATNIYQGAKTEYDGMLRTLIERTSPVISYQPVPLVE